MPFHLKRSLHLKLRASTALVLIASLTAGSALAQSTWTGAGTDWNTGANWSPAGIPGSSGTAVFTNNGAPTGVSTNVNTQIGTLNFAAGAPGYIITLGNDLTINTAVTNSSGVNQRIATGGNNSIFLFGVTGSNVTYDLTAGGTVLAYNSAGGDSAYVLTGGARLALLTTGPSFVIGSLAGTGGQVGNYTAAPSTLVIGGLNTSTTFGGTFSEHPYAISIEKVGTGTLILTGNNTYTGLTTITGGTLQIGAGGTTGTLGTNGVMNNAALVFTRSDDITIGNAISGSGTLTQAGGGSVTLTGANTYSGITTINAGAILRVGNGGTIGTLGIGNVVNNGTLGFFRSDNVTVANAISGAGDVVAGGTGTTTLTGTSSYIGATSVTAGTLLVNGSIASSSGLTVAAGSIVGGTGTLPSTIVSGTLSPGNSPGTLTVNGNLTLNPGSLYLAEIQGANADRVNVTGTASLAGTLRLAPLGGAYTFNSAYTLLSAAGGRTGAFSPVDTTGTFGDGVTTTVSYTANDVLLTLAPKPLTPGTPGSPTLGVTQPRNAYAIATSIDTAVANGGDPSALFGIYNLPAASIPAAVNSLSGEVHTAAPAMANLAADQFLRSMLDQTAAGRLGAGAAGPGTAAFSGLMRKGTDQPAAPSRFDLPFYSVWGSAYGSYGRTDGSAAIGSAKRTIDDAHLATGIDIRLLPGTVAGVAVSGGKAQASLPGLIGKIDADVFQAGLYGVTQLGRMKLGGALSYARLENDVSRGIPALGSSLSSSYATTAWSGRLQASAALLDWNGIAVSPLAAIQATEARSPAVVEANWAGANAGALALNKRSEVTSRSEIGVQLDADSMLGGVPVTGYVRAAWAHYFRRDADLTASLIGLPAASFTATGVQADRNSALLSAGIAAKLSERVTLGLNLDGELSANSTRLGGSAQLKVSF